MNATKKLKEFKNKLDTRQANERARTYRLDIRHAEDGSIEVTQVRKLDLRDPVSSQQSTWMPVDKRGFVRGFLNNIEKFITK